MPRHLCTRLPPASKLQKHLDADGEASRKRHSLLPRPSRQRTTCRATWRSTHGCECKRGTHACPWPSQMRESRSAKEGRSERERCGPVRAGGWEKMSLPRNVFGASGTPPKRPSTSPDVPTRQHIARTHNPHAHLLLGITAAHPVAPACSTPLCKPTVQSLLR